MEPRLQTGRDLSKTIHRHHHLYCLPPSSFHMCSLPPLLALPRDTISVCTRLLLLLLLLLPPPSLLLHVFLLSSLAFPLPPREIREKPRKLSAYRVIHQGSRPSHSIGPSDTAC